MAEGTGLPGTLERQAREDAHRHDDGDLAVARDLLPQPREQLEPRRAVPVPVPDDVERDEQQVRLQSLQVSDRALVAGPVPEARRSFTSTPAEASRPKTFCLKGPG